MHQNLTYFKICKPKILFFKIFQKFLQNTSYVKKYFPEVPEGPQNVKKKLI